MPIEVALKSKKVCLKKRSFLDLKTARYSHIDGGRPNFFSPRLLRIHYIARIYAIGRHAIFWREVNVGGRKAK